MIGPERKHPWLSQNLTNQDVNSSSTLTLACYALGVPPPYITWYKDNIPVEEGPGEACLTNTMLHYTFSVTLKHFKNITS